MTAAIADILKSKLVNLPWIERFAGLVTPATRPLITTGADGVQVVAGYQVCPVACDVNAANCWENGKYKLLEPDSTKTAIAFFTDNGGATFKEIQGPKNAYLVFSFDLKFLCWLNLERIGQELTYGHCNVSGRLAPLVMKQFYGCHSAFGKFDGAAEEEALQSIEVTSLSQYAKTSAIFQPFTFAVEGEKRGLFMYPYDYFGIRIGGTFRVNVKCLEDVFFRRSDDYCIDGSGILHDTTPSIAIMAEDGVTAISNESNDFIIQE